MADDTETIVAPPDAVYLAETQKPPPAPPPIVPAPPAVPPVAPPINIGAAAGGGFPVQPPQMVPQPPAAPAAAAMKPPIAGTGLQGEEAMIPEITADIRRRQGRLDEAETRQGTISQEAQEALKSKSEAMTREQGEMTAVYDQLKGQYAKGVPPLKQQQIDPYKRPIAPPDQLLTSMGVMAALAALFGSASRGPYSGAMAAMTGAMEGWQQRDDKIVEQSMKEYAENVAAIRTNNESLKAEWESAKEEHKNNIEGLLSAAKGIAIKYDLGDVGQADIRLQRADKAGAALDKHVDSMQRGIDNLFKLKESILDHIAKAEQQKLKLAQQQSGFFEWDDATFTARRILAGESGASLGMGTGQVGSYNRTLTTRALRSIAQSENLPPATVARAQAQLAAVKSGMRQNETRAVAVQRLTGQIEGQWGIIKDLVEKGAGPSGIPAADAPINTIRRHLGDEDLAAFDRAIQTLATNYQEAMTMPGSNAQMHEGSRINAERFLNTNQPFRVLESVYNVMLREIENADKAYAAVAERERAKIGGPQAAPQSTSSDW